MEELVSKKKRILALWIQEPMLSARAIADRLEIDLQYTRNTMSAWRGRMPVTPTTTCPTCGQPIRVRP